MEVEMKVERWKDGGGGEGGYVRWTEGDRGGGGDGNVEVEVKVEIEVER